MKTIANARNEWNSWFRNPFVFGFPVPHLPSSPSPGSLFALALAPIGGSAYEFIKEPIRFNNIADIIFLSIIYTVALQLVNSFCAFVSAFLSPRSPVGSCLVCMPNKRRRYITIKAIWPRSGRLASSSRDREMCAILKTFPDNECAAVDLRDERRRRRTVERKHALQKRDHKFIGCRRCFGGRPAAVVHFVECDFYCSFLVARFPSRALCAGAGDECEPLGWHADWTAAGHRQGRAHVNERISLSPEPEPNENM